MANCWNSVDNFSKDLVYTAPGFLETGGHMERRIYFIVGDVLVCLVAGAGAGWLVQYVVPGHWYPLIGMVIGMALGMFVGMLAGFLFGPFFGAFEVMLPASLSGMLAGMIVGMAYTMG